MATRDETIKLSLIDGVTKSLASIQKGVGGVGAELAKLNQVAELAGKAFDGLASVGNFFGDLVNDAGAYEQKLLEVQVRTQATAEESKLLRDAVQEALQGTATGATAAADALRLMAEDGASATEAAQNLGEVVAYAQANTRGLAETVGGLGAVLDAFGEGAGKIGALADALTATAVAAGTSTAAIEKGLAGAGVAAASANLSLEETTAIIGTLAERGIEGGRAVAAVTKILGELQAPASAAGQALREAGIDTTDLSGIFGTLATDAGLAEKVLSSLGKKPRDALKILLAEGGAALTGITKAINESAGATQKASDALGEGYPLALKRLQESLANAKIALATPLLEPLAGAFDTFATKINTFAQSEQFKAIANEIAEFVASGLEQVTQFVEGFDFDQAAASTTQFVADAKVELAALREAFGLTLTSGANFGDGLTASFNASIAAVSLNLAGLVGALGGVSDEAESLSLSLAAIGDDAFIATGDALGRIAGRADEAAKAAGELRKEAVSAVGPLNAFNKTLEDQLANATSLPPAFSAVANSVMRVTAAEIELAEAQRQLNRTMTAATTATYEAELGRLVRQQTELINSGKTSGIEFAKLSAEIAAAEGAIAKLREASAGAGDAIANTGNNASEAASRFREYADAAGSAADSVSESSSSLSESFGTFRESASSTAETVASVTLALTELDAAAARADSSAFQGNRLFIQSINRRIAANKELMTILDQRIEQEKRLAMQADESAQIEAQLIARYGDQGEKIKELARLIDENNKRRQEAIDLTERETSALERNAQARVVSAGTLGTGRAAEAAPLSVATGGRGSTQQGGGDRATSPQIVINVQGMTSDQARDFVSRSVVPELERINRLGR